MKSEAMLQGPAEAAIRREIAELAEWLAARGLDVHGENAHEDEGSRDRLYWRYGYFVGLKRAFALLAGERATAQCVS
jgi:hypothetical protein